VLATSLLCFTPGPTVVVVIGQALVHGKQSVLPLASGVLLGDLVACILSLGGLSLLLATSATLFMLLKWAGAIYLIFYGVRMWRSNSVTDTANHHKSGQIVRATALITALNPKAIVFFTAFFPLFIQPDKPVLIQVLILLLTHLFISMLSVFTYAFFSWKLSQVIKKQNAAKVLDRIGGSVLIGAGVLTGSVQK